MASNPAPNPAAMSSNSAETLSVPAVHVFPMKTATVIPPQEAMALELAATASNPAPVTDARPQAYKLHAWKYNANSRDFHLYPTLRTLGAKEVLIKTTHSGLCYTDVHAKEKGCGLGHEGVGIIERLGGAVTSLVVGQRVGWGWLHSSCGNCQSCVDGYRQYCASARGFAYSDQDQGAFGDYRIILAEFVYAIPASIPSAHAAPLMCAGASVYEALNAANVKPSDRVGVYGVGGLGSMAIQFSKAMGCGVTAISSGSDGATSLTKMNNAFELGADEFRLAEDPLPWANTEFSINTSKGNGKMINVLLITSNVLPEWRSLLPILARRATIVLMTIQDKPLAIPYMSFILPGHRLIASTEASRRNHIDMLVFVEKNKIVPRIEEFSMSKEGIAAAFEKLEAGKMRYRGVLVVPVPARKHSREEEENAYPYVQTCNCKGHQHLSKK